METSNIEEIIELGRYPVNLPDSPATRKLIRDGREALNEMALFSLDGFIRSDVVDEMVADLENLATISCRIDQLRSAYDYNISGWPEGLPDNQ